MQDNQALRDQLDIERLVLLCKTEPEVGMQQMLAVFEPLDAASTRRTRMVLPNLDADEAETVVRHELLLLVSQFDSRRNVPFINYLSSMLPRRMQNWVSRERRVHTHEVAYAAGNDDADQEDESAVAACATYSAWDETTLGLWWEQTLADLTPRQGQVMRFVLEGRTEDDIARVTGVAAATVHKVKVRAQKKLQDKW